MKTQQTLLTAIRDVAARVEQFGQAAGTAVNEANTKNWFIEPLLQAMGWDTHDPTAVQAEYRAQGAGQNPVDYALMVDGAPALFLEAKALGTPLQTPQFVNQVVAYGAVAGVRWVVITDGNEYRIYRTDTAAAAPDKLLATFKLTEESQRDEAEQFLGMLQRNELALDKLTGLWAERDADRKVRVELRRLLSGADAGFVKYLSKRIPGLRGPEVSASLKRATVSIAFPKAVLAVPALPDEKLRAVGGVTPKSGDRLSRLVETLARSGAIFPVSLHRTYKGRQFTASLGRDGRVTLGGDSFESLSGAANAAKASLPDAPKSVASNGWRFWRYARQDGTSVRVGELVDDVTT